MTIKEIADACGVSRTTVYNYARKVGHVPTLEEFQTRTAVKGRPRGEVAALEEKTGVNRRTIERMRQKNGRLPTEEELERYKARRART